MNIVLNGIGRIGKAILRISHDIENINIVAINDINSNIQNIAYAINYDSTYGIIKDKYKVDGSYIQNSKTKHEVLNHRRLQDIDLSNIDIIIDSSGAKVDTKILKTLDVRYIFLTHPNSSADINVVLGINHDKIDTTTDKIVSTSSCNATAILPALKSLDEKFGIVCGDIVTVHPLLNHQKTLDAKCIGSDDRDIKCNFEFGRGAMQNIIPSGTTTIDACSLVLQQINSDIFSSNSFRVPTDVVGAINISVYTKQSCNKDEVIQLFENIAKNQKFDIFLNNHEPLVSKDFQQQRFTTIVDHRWTDVKNDHMIKLVLWYDNEWGYASRVLDIVGEFLNQNN
ncbi:MAG: glyceraldehyde-3-phosphate dehydrogenase [Campylobacteraceae bacterium 4484_166]|nr:MAG: glyceraldehyde-3-phosphate dehydrogenase [Campylobacteraceae bacterium 4484_166]